MSLQHGVYLIITIKATSKIAARSITTNWNYSDDYKWASIKVQKEG